MKTNYPFVIAITLFLLAGCANTGKVLAPKGSVPKRTYLATDVYGSYIRVNTTDQRLFLGELIGLRNDSIVVLGDSIVSIPIAEVDSARIIVHAPASYEVGLLTLLPNIGLFTLGNYGSGPAELGLLLSLIDLVGYGAAASTENLKINYYDWSEGPTEVLKYARFPGGIPESIPLSALEKRKVSTRK